jgi:hypothetical protein
LVWRPEGKRPLDRPGRRWDDNIKMDFKKKDGGLDWIDLADDRDMTRALLNTVMNHRVLHCVGNSLAIRGTTGFSKRTLLLGVRARF